LEIQGILYNDFLFMIFVLSHVVIENDKMWFWQHTSEKCLKDGCFLSHTRTSEKCHQGGWLREMQKGTSICQLTRASDIPNIL